MPRMVAKAPRTQGRGYNPDTNSPHRLVRSVELDNCIERVVTAKASE